MVPSLSDDRLLGRFGAGPSSAVRRIVGDMELEFAGEIVEWRGPAPYYFVPLPPDEADLIDEVKADVAYWGVIPVTAQLGESSFTTSMFPREETYFLPLKDAVRRAEGVGLGDLVEVRLTVGRE